MSLAFVIQGFLQLMKWRNSLGAKSYNFLNGKVNVIVDQHVKNQRLFPRSDRSKNVRRFKVGRTAIHLRKIASLLWY